jgi:hypothetical protein
MENLSSAPYIAVTPMYGIRSDAEELGIGELFHLVKFREDLLSALREDDVLLKHARLYPPDYLLWQRAPVADADLRASLTPASFEVEGGISKLYATLSVLFNYPATNLFRLLRLFKPGRLSAGDTFVLSCETLGGGIWETAFGKRCSEMIIDYGLLAVQEGSYTLLSAEVPFLNVFSKALLPQLELLQNPAYLSAPPPLEVALLLYNEDESRESVAVLNALTALEALLTTDSNTELSYRLSLRVANLLESDDASRLSTFKEMKEFYDLRSKIIHGSASKISTKLHNRLERSESLREIVRRTILSVMSIFLDAGSMDIHLDEVLDQIVFDEAKRRQIQKSAAKFLFLDGSPTSVVH